MKTKALWLLAVSAALVIFAMQNWHYPTPALQFLGYRFPPLPHALIIYSSFALGFLAGWMAHVFRAKKRKPAIPPEPSPENHSPAPSPPDHP